MQVERALRQLSLHCERARETILIGLPCAVARTVKVAVGATICAVGRLRRWEPPRDAAD